MVRYNNSKDKIEINLFRAFVSKIPCECLFVGKLIIVLIIAVMYFPQIFSFGGNYSGNVLSLEDITDFKKLRINPTSEYSFLSKKEIFDIRKKYVEKSLFAKDNYEPSVREFGSIVDDKPWWGDIQCLEVDYQGDYSDRIVGDSLQSKQLNNPNVLVGFSAPYIPWNVEENEEYCSSSYSRFIPYSLKYSEKSNLIVVEYFVPRSFLDMRVNISNASKRFPIQLSGLNALDFGYKYVYASDIKNVEMQDSSNNITHEIKEFVDYIHVGHSCKYEGGCNNISPTQYDKIFTVTGLPAEINLKLWKKLPRTKKQKADINYKIIINEY